MDPAMLVNNLAAFAHGSRGAHGLYRLADRLNDLALPAPWLTIAERFQER
jgi:hypothetical protein